jgi:hypothetical protein
MLRSRGRPRNLRGNPAIANFPQVRTRAEKARDVIEIGDLWLKGLTAEKITDWINNNRPYRISQSQVMKDLQLAREQWRDRLDRTREDLVSEELKRIEAVETECWRAYFRSVFGIDENENDPTSNNGDRFQLIPIEEAKKKKARAVPVADSMKFLNILMTSSAQRARLLGLNAPNRVLSAHINGAKMLEMAKNIARERGIEIDDMYLDDVVEDANRILLGLQSENPE